MVWMRSWNGLPVIARTGCPLRDLELPERRSCLVVAHSVWDASAGRWHRRPPEARRTLAEGDRLVVIGPSAEVARMAG
jgi:hypothetical protein